MEMQATKPLPKEVQAELELQVGFLDSLPDNKITLPRVKEILFAAQVPPDQPIWALVRQYMDDAAFTHQGVYELFKSAGITLDIDVRLDGQPPKGEEIEVVRPPRTKPESVSAGSALSEPANINDSDYAGSSAGFHGFAGEDAAPAPHQTQSHPGSDSIDARGAVKNAQGAEPAGKPLEVSLAGAVLAKVFGLGKESKTVVSNPDPLAAARAGFENLISGPGGQGDALSPLLGANLNAMNALRGGFESQLRQIITGKTDRGAAMSPEARSALSNAILPSYKEYSARAEEVARMLASGKLSADDARGAADELRHGSGIFSAVGKGKDDPSVAKLHEISEMISKAIERLLDAVFGKTRSASHAGPGS